MLFMRIILNIHFVLFGEISVSESGCLSGVPLSSALATDENLWNWRVCKRAYLLIREDEKREKV